MYKFNKSEKGNVLFIILIAIALFATLSFALKGSGNNAEDMFSDIQVEKQAEQLIAHMSAIKAKVVTMIEVNSTNPADISAIIPTDANFNTTPPPNMNKIYHPLGGGITYTDSMAGASGIVYNNTLTITGVGTASADIAMVAEVPSLRYCQTINETLLGSNNVPTITDATGTNMLAPAAVTLDDATTCSATGGCDNVAYQCIQTASGTYIYYHLLYAR